MAMTTADLVLEGGGVKGTGLIGAITALTEHQDSYEFHRIAGASAGAIVASFLAAGINPGALKQIMTEQDFTQFEDEAAVFKHLKLFGEGFGLLFHEGLFAGDALHTFIAQHLAQHGVTTWGDLKIDDDELPAEQRYKLVVVVSDVSHGRELRLPWDYRSKLGVDPDSQSVADAVRSSAGIPFFFRPFRLPAANEVSAGNGYVLGTDGGMLSNYPIDIFDRPTGARWPTLGVKLSARQQVTTTAWKSDANALQLATSLVSTMTDARDQLHVDDPYYSNRTIFVDTTGFSSTNFHLTTTDKLTLFTNGHNAAQQFLTTWDYQQWLAANAPRAPRAPFDATKPPPATNTPTSGTGAPAAPTAERDDPP
jgi:NTE family protein